MIVVEVVDFNYVNPADGKNYRNGARFRMDAAAAEACPCVKRAEGDTAPAGNQEVTGDGQQARGAAPNGNNPHSGSGKHHKKGGGR